MAIFPALTNQTNALTNIGSSDTLQVGAGVSSSAASLILQANGVTKLTISSTSADFSPLTAIYLPGSNQAGAGDIRAANGTTIIGVRNSAHNADVSVISTGANIITIGDTVDSNIRVQALNTLVLAAGGSDRFTVNTTLVTSTLPFVFVNSLATPYVKQTDLTTNSGTGQTLTIQAQNETGTTSVGGDLALTSGTGTSTVGNVIVQTGGTTRLTVSPTLITSALPIVLQGSNPATVGDIRAVNGSTIIAFRRADNGADIVALSTDSSNDLFVGGTGVSILQEKASNLYRVAGSISYFDASALITATLTLAHAGATSLSIAETVTSFTLTQSAKTTDVVPADLTIQPQFAFASATGGDRKPGDLVVNVGTPTNSGTAEARLTIKRTGTFSASIGPYETAGGTFSALYLGPGLVPSGTNFSFLSDGSGITDLNVPTGGVIQFVFNGSSTSAGAVVLSAASMAWSTLSTPVIKQSDLTTNSGTGAAFTVQAQNETGTTSTGGQLNLQSGTGTTIDGYVVLKTGTTTRLTVAPAIITSTLPVISSSVIRMGSLPGATTYGALHCGATDAAGPTISNYSFASDGGDTVIFGSAQVRLVNPSGSNALTVTSVVTLGEALVLQGSNSATTGDIRAVNNTTIISARNAVNGANLQVLATDGSNDIYFGDTSGGAIANAAALAISLYAGGAAKLTAANTVVTITVPLVAPGIINCIAYVVGTTATTDSTRSIPADGYVLSCQIKILTSYSNGATISVGQQGSVSLFASVSDINAQGVAGDIYGVEQFTLAFGALPVRVTVGGAPASGQCVVIIKYSEVSG